jgi:mRNA interferase RelE/StbE
MSYKLTYTLRALKDISKLPKNIKDRIKKSLEKYVENPLLYARKMIDTTFGTYRFRIDDYRVIFDFKDDELIILRVGYRSKVYGDN